jgi:hypothetical protein
LGAISSYSGELAVATDRDFERKVLPFLRLFWKDLVQAPSKKTWDAKGIDLLTNANEKVLNCVVQCKGFEVQELLADHAIQVRDSVERFIQSGVECDTYLLVHNRDRRQRGIHKRIEGYVARASAEGGAKHSEVWDRQTLIKQAEKKIQEIINDRLRKHSNLLLHRLEVLFEETVFWIANVPIAEQRIKFRHLKDCDIGPLSQYRSRSLTEALFDTDKTRWSMLTGSFGMGKTTAALLTATDSHRTTVYIECSKLKSDDIGGGVNALMREAISSLDLFESSCDQDRFLHEQLAGVTLNKMLRTSPDDYLIIVDGLDENRFYSRIRGFGILSNQLSEFNCPIILITRREHFKETIGDISSAFFEWSRKNGPSREAKVLDLGLWNEEQISQIVDGVGKQHTGDEQSNLLQLQRIVRDGRAQEIYGDVISRPLFLQFIISDVLEEGVRPQNRTELIGGWVSRKIKRDRQTPRMSLDLHIDTNQFVRQMSLLMEDAAANMVEQGVNSVELQEFVGEYTLIHLAREHFGKMPDSVLGIILNSLLVPVSFRRDDRELQLKFVHRLFQEYFVARWVRRQGVGANRYPIAVRDLLKELQMR